MKHYGNWDRALYILSFGIAIYGIFQLLAAKLFTMGMKRGLVEIIYDLNNMPKTMRQLAWVTLFTWFAMFAMWIYLLPRRSPANTISRWIKWW